MAELDWKEYFYYEQGHLYWAKPRGFFIQHGMRAGSLETRGKNKRVRVAISGKKYDVATIIYTMLRRPVPEGYCIAFINGNPEITAIWNLKLVKKE